MKAKFTLLIPLTVMVHAEDFNAAPAPEAAPTPAAEQPVEAPADEVPAVAPSEEKVPAGEPEVSPDTVVDEAAPGNAAEAPPAGEDPQSAGSDELILEIDSSDELVIETEDPAPVAEAAAPPEKPAGDWEFTLGGAASAEIQVFPQSPKDPRQEDFGLSFALEPELKWRNRGAGLTAQFTPFARYDTADDERTHADVREFSLRKEFAKSDLLAGVSKVFWGAMETVHWVDVINQTDLIENIDGEAKLGQPMINYNQFTDYGRFSFFVLPGFRERTFPGAEGRLRVHPRIDGDRPLYESGARTGHVDFALRWSKSFGDIDVGCSWFHGTSREPTYIPGLLSSGEVILRPYYEIVDQIGLDGTWNLDDWLFKSEIMIRSGQGDETFCRAAAGFEYTFHGVAGSAVDVGMIGEYLYDSLGNNPINPFENDLAYGARISFNDIRDTVLLLTAITDTRDGSTFCNLEASMRFGEHWLATAQARAFAGVPANDYPLNGMRRDHYVQLGIEYHF